LALIFIFVDHIPENIVSYFTLQAAQFFDAAEVFIFISGYTAALVYGRTLAMQGTIYAAAQALRRAWQLYVAHIFLFVIFIAEVSYIVTTFKNPMYNDEMRVADFLDEPHIAIVEALLLQFQPTFLDILPLYIILLAVFPVILIGLRHHSVTVLALSFLLYVIVQVTNLSVAAYPEGHVWYFNPFAWQFLFAAGAALGLGKLKARWLRPGGPLIVMAIGIAGAGLVVKLSWTIHGIWDPFPGLFLKELWPVNKNNLSPVRLAPFFATVALVAAVVPSSAGFLRATAAKPVILCGQQSLEVFCLGILLSALGHFALTEYHSSIGNQLAVNAAGIFVLCMTAKMIDWYKITSRVAPTVSAPSPGTGVNSP